MMHNCRQNINLKPLSFTVLLLLVLSQFIFGSTDVNHVIIKLNGNAYSTLIDSMNSRMIYHTDPETGKSSTIPLKDVYMVFNDFNRLFYISPSFIDRIAYLEDWGGTLETLDGRVYNYSEIRFNKTMTRPEFYLVLESDSARGISLFDVYKIKADKSANELAVKKGFKTSIMLFAAGTTIDIFRYYLKNKDSGIASLRTFQQLGKGAVVHTTDLLPGYNFLGMNRTGVTYQSVVFGIPAFTMGWMVYDTVVDRRASYFIPHSGVQKFPRNMYFFNLSRIYNNKKAQLRSKLPKMPKIPFLNK